MFTLYSILPYLPCVLFTIVHYDTDFTHVHKGICKVIVTTDNILCKSGNDIMYEFYGPIKNISLISKGQEENWSVRVT